MRICVFFIIVVLLGGCRSLQPSSETIETVKDSTVTTVRYVEQDTMISVPGDTLKFQVPIYELSETPIERTAGRTTARVSLKGDELTVECLTEEYEKIITYQNEIIETLREINRTKETTIKVPEKYTPWYTKTLAWIGGIALTFGVGLIIFKFIKPF